MNLIVAVSYPNVYPLAEQTVQQAYLAEGKIQAYAPDMVRFTSPEQYAYAAACLGMIQREKVAACVFVGHFASEAVNFAEAAAAINAISIAGTTSTYQLPFFAAACDYTLIGEELLVFDGIIVPAASAFYAMACFHVASAAYRAFRAHNGYAVALLVTGVILMLARAPVGEVAFPGLPKVANWIMQVVNLAGMRGIMISSAIGVVCVGARVLLGIDRSHL